MYSATPCSDDEHGKLTTWTMTYGLVEDDVNNLIDLLRGFNRKERFFLIQEALDKPGFLLGKTFGEQLGRTFDLAVPKDAFVAMDYHLDWLYAALVLAAGGKEGAAIPNPEMPRRPALGPEAQPALKMVQGNQEDVDLLVAFEGPTVSHVLLLEAKVESAWDNDQMRSKARRFGAIFDYVALKKPELVRPHFAVVSPRPPQNLQTADWPAWMLRDGTNPLHIPIPGPMRPLIVERCDQNCEPAARGEYFQIYRREK